MLIELPNSFGYPTTIPPPSPGNYSPVFLPIFCLEGGGKSIRESAFLYLILTNRKDFEGKVEVVETEENQYVVLEFLILWEIKLSIIKHIPWTSRHQAYIYT